jgi:predicted Zn-dependent protease
MPNRIRPLVAWAVLSAWAAGGVLAEEPPEQVVITPTEEAAWGMHVLRSFLETRDLGDDEEQAERLVRIGAEVAAVSDRPDRSFAFLLVEGSDLQAFAFPGGSLCVTESLARLFESDDQLAFLLGHELAHIVLRHQVSKRQFERAVTAAPTLGDEIAPARVFYDRHAELEADSFGALYAVRAGYAFSASHESLEILAAAGIGGADATHPAVAERLRFLEGFREELTGALKAFDLGVEALDAGNPEVAIPLFELFVASFPDSLAGRVNLGAGYLTRVRNTSGTPQNLAETLPILPSPGIVLRGPLDVVDLQRARANFEHALKRHPDVPWAAAGLALVETREGRIAEGRELLAGALERVPEQPDLMLCLGNVEFVAGRFGPAAALYRRTLEQKREWPHAQANLARALERLGEEAEALALWQRLTDHERFGAEARLRLAASDAEGSER